MITKTLTVDFSKTVGKLKIAPGVTGGPRRGGALLPIDLTSYYKQLNPPAIRISDIEAPYGTNRFLDIHCIFPNPSADETIEDSYDFSATDMYIARALECGAELFVRLGETPDPFPKPRYAYPSCSYHKWARICEHIIMHYNEGWASGFKYNIKNFEIWSCADEACSWSGTAEEFYGFYTVVSKHLKSRFSRIKIGAYGCGGFASLNRIDTDGKQKAYIDFLGGFLKYASKNSAPLDFFTWRCCASTPEEIAIHSRYARAFLDEHGYKRCKSIISELSLPQSRGGESDGMFAFLASTLVVGIKAECDYIFLNTLTEGYGGLLHYPDNSPTAAFYACTCVSKLSHMENRIETTGDSRGEVYSASASNGDEAALMIVSRSFSGKIELRFTSHNFSLVEVTRITDKGTDGAPSVKTKRNIPLSSAKIAITAENSEVFYLRLYN